MDGKFNRKVKTINLLEENRIFWGLQILFTSTQNTNIIIKNDKFNYIKNKNFSSSKDTIPKREIIE